MRIGILPCLNSAGGGIYQYSLTMLRALSRSKEVCEDEFIVFAENVLHPALTSLCEPNWTIELMRSRQASWRQQTINKLRIIIGEGLPREVWRSLRRVIEHPKASLTDLGVKRSSLGMSRQFRRAGVELALYPFPQTLSFETSVPYVMAIHDLQHRLQPEFPEVSANGEWDAREYLFRNGARYATLILADSEVGKEDILYFYGSFGVAPDRVKVLPFVPPHYMAGQVSESERQLVRTKYQLPERYLFYPAQFWPHKNHIRIIEALGLLKQDHRLEVPVVFCGSHTGALRERTFQEVMSLASQRGLEREVRYLGYVSDNDMSALYANAASLVMPTFFGPTNIPILEAWAFSFPVLTSDIRGIREQVQSAGLLVDPRSVEAIADGIYRLWMDENLTCTLAELGRQRLACYTPDDYRQRLIAILEEAKTRV